MKISGLNSYPQWGKGSDVHHFAYLRGSKQTVDIDGSHCRLLLAMSREFWLAVVVKHKAKMLCSHSPQERDMWMVSRGSFTVHKIARYHICYDYSFRTLLWGEYVLKSPRVSSVLVQSYCIKWSVWILTSTTFPDWETTGSFVAVWHLH